MITPYRYTDRYDFDEHMDKLRSLGATACLVQFNFYIDYEGVKRRFTTELIEKDGLLVKVWLE